VVRVVHIVVEVGILGDEHRQHVLVALALSAGTTRAKRRSRIRPMSSDDASTRWRNSAWSASLMSCVKRNRTMCCMVTPRPPANLSTAQGGASLRHSGDATHRWAGPVDRERMDQGRVQRPSTRREA
jgi:hypothetical protein